MDIHSISCFYLKTNMMDIQGYVGVIPELSYKRLMLLRHISYRVNVGGKSDSSGKGF